MTMVCDSLHNYWVFNGLALSNDLGLELTDLYDVAAGAVAACRERGGQGLGAWLTVFSSSNNRLSTDLSPAGRDAACPAVSRDNSGSSCCKFAV